LRLAAAAGVLVAMMAVVVTGLQASALSVDQLSGAQQRRAAQVETDTFTCLETAMRARIPVGSLVLNEGADVLHRQRIAEELTPGYHFVDRPVSGSYRVRFTRPGPCFGLGVDVTRVASR
jgi:hypothetical protein